MSRLFLKITRAYSLNIRSNVFNFLLVANFNVNAELRITCYYPSTLYEFLQDFSFI